MLNLPEIDPISLTAEGQKGGPSFTEMLIFRMKQHCPKHLDQTVEPRKLHKVLTSFALKATINKHYYLWDVEDYVAKTITTG